MDLIKKPPAPSIKSRPVKHKAGVIIHRYCADGATCREIIVCKGECARFEEQLGQLKESHKSRSQR